MRIEREKTIGIVIDIQERLVPVMEEKEVLIENCSILIKGLKQLGVPLIVTQQYTKGLGETVSEIKSLFENFKYFEKKDFSCYSEPEIVEAVNQTDARFVILCGIESHVCVLQTAVDIKDAGYIPVVVMDCVSSRFYDNIDLAAERFRYEGIMMSSYESLLFELTKSAGTPEFKEISKLVK